MTMTDEPLEPIDIGDANAIADVESPYDDSESPPLLAEEATPPGPTVPDELEKEIVPLSQWNDTVVSVVESVLENLSSLAEREQLRQAREEHERLAREAARDDLEEDTSFTTSFLAGPGCYVDATGVYQRPLPLGVKTERYGKTDEALEKDGQVTVSLWSYDAENEEWSDSGEDQEEVHDSFWYQGLTLPSGTKVKIRYCSENARWEIVWVPWLTVTLFEDLAPGGSASVEEDIDTVYAPDFMPDTISNGQKIKVAWDIENDHWEVIERGCEST